MKMQKKTKIANNIYDYLKILSLPKGQNDDWAELSRKHGKEAKKELKKFLKNKNIAVADNAIQIGRYIRIVIL